MQFRMTVSLSPPVVSMPSRRLSWKTQSSTRAPRTTPLEPPVLMPSPWHFSIRHLPENQVLAARSDNRPEAAGDVTADDLRLAAVHQLEMVADRPHQPAVLDQEIALAASLNPGRLVKFTSCFSPVGPKWGVFR